MINRITGLILFVFVLTLNPLRSVAQTTNVLEHTIAWTSSSCLDMKSNVTYSKTAKFVTYKQEKIEIPNPRIEESVLTSVEGAWEDINASGILIYNVTLNGAACVVTLEKNSDGTFLTLDMSASSPMGTKRKYVIDSFEIIQ